MALRRFLESFFSFFRFFRFFQLFSDLKKCKQEMPLPAASIKRGRMPHPPQPHPPGSARLGAWSDRSATGCDKRLGGKGALGRKMAVPGQICPRQCAAALRLLCQASWQRSRILRPAVPGEPPFFCDCAPAAVPGRSGLPVSAFNLQMRRIRRLSVFRLVFQTWR